MDSGGDRAHAEAMNAANENDTTAGTRSSGAGPLPPAGPRLARSTDDKIVSGLCGGLGRHFGVDPVMFRIAFVVLALAGGSGVLLYLVGWLLVPDDRSGATILDRARHGHSSQVLAAVLLAGGAIVVFDRLGDHGGGGWFGGLVLLGVGAAVLWSRRGQSTALPPSPPAPPPPPPSPPSPPPPWAPPPPLPLSSPGFTGEPPTSEVPTSEVPSTEVPTSPSADPGDTATAGLAPGRSPDATTVCEPAGSPVPPVRCARRPPSVLMAATFSVLAILAGVLALLVVTGTADVPVAVGLALALLVVGVALVVGGWRGRARWLIPVGVVLGVALLGASAVDVPLRGGVGDHAYRLRAVSDLRSPYRLAAGDLEVDLSGLDLSSTSATVTATVGAGELLVVVPDGAEVIVDAHVGAGTMTVFGRQSDGMDTGRHLVEPGREGGGRLVLTARAGFGDLEVRHASS